MESHTADVLERGSCHRARSVQLLDAGQPLGAPKEPQLLQDLGGDAHTPIVEVAILLRVVAG